MHGACDQMHQHTDQQPKAGALNNSHQQTSGNSEGESTPHTHVLLAGMRRPHHPDKCRNNEQAQGLEGPACSQHTINVMGSGTNKVPCTS